jgi:hypothetical protein
MNGRAIVEGAVRSVADRYGFRSVRNRNFYASGPEISGIVNIQKSQYGPSFYLNAGVWLNSLPGDVPTAEYKYHVRWRIESIGDDHTITALRQALDLEVDMPDSERIDAIRNGSEKNGFGLISTFKDEDSVLRFIARTPRALVLKEVREQAKRKLGEALS